MGGLGDYVIIDLEEWAKLRAVYKRAKELKHSPSVELQPECQSILCELVTDFSSVMSEIMIQPAVKKAMDLEDSRGERSNDHETSKE